MRVNARTLAPLSAVGLLATALAGCGDPGREPLAMISPAEPGTEDVLRLQIGDYEGYTYEVSWSMNGAPVEDDLGREIDPDLTERGQLWEASVTPVDEDGKRFDPVTVSVTIGNAPPAGIVTLSPGAPGTGTDLVAQPGFIDPDGDEVSATYSWTQNGSDAGISGDTVPGDRLAKGDVWEVTVVASDGTGESMPVSASTTVANTAPQAEGAVISPEQVFDDTTVSCTGIRFFDPDGDPEGYKYIWKVDGSIVSSEPELTGEFFDRGQTLTCELIPTDGEDDGNRVFSAPILVGNGVPTMDSVTIDDSAPNRNAPVTFTVNGLNDADGDEVTLDVWWLVNGRGVSKETELDPSLFEKGDEIRARVTPSDGRDTGETVTSDAVTVVNAPPVIEESLWNVTPVYTDSMLSPSATVVDNDGDTFTLTWTWKVSGSTVGDTTGMLDGTNTEGDGFDRGDTVSYTLVADDGTDTSEVFTSTVETVANKPPEIAGATFDPPLTLPSEDVICVPAGEVVDADGDTVTLEAVWTRNGSTYAGLTDTTSFTGDTIPYSATTLKEKWGCTIEADDGTDSTTTDEAVATIRPERIIYYVESQSDLGNAGNTCTGTDGSTKGYYGTSIYYTSPFEFKFDDEYSSDPDRVTISWRQGYWTSFSSYGYYYFNGARLSYTNLGIARSGNCDSGRTYSVTFSGIQSSGLWNEGGENSVGIVHGCCSRYNIGTFYDDEYKWGAMRVFTDLDPEE